MRERESIFMRDGCLRGTWRVLEGWAQRVDTTTPSPSIPTL